MFMRMLKKVGLLSFFAKLSAHLVPFFVENPSINDNVSPAIISWLIINLALLVGLQPLLMFSLFLFLFLPVSFFRLVLLLLPLDKLDNLIVFLFCQLGEIGSISQFSRRGKIELPEHLMPWVELYSIKALSNPVK